MSIANILDPLPCPKGMNSREIVCRAIDYREPPRIPYSFFYNPNASDIFTIHSLASAVQKPDQTGQTYVDEWGVTWEVTGRLWDHAKVSPLADLTNLEDYRFPDKANPERFTPLNNIFNQAKSAEKYLVAADPIMMFELTRSLMGFEEHMIAPYTQPDRLKELLDKLANLTIECIKRYAELGEFDAFMTWEDWGLQSGLQMDMETFREYYRPRYQRIIDAAHDAGMHYIWHNCGNVEEMLPDKIEMGVDVVQFDQPRLSGHQHLMELIGGRICMWNTVDIQWSVNEDITDQDIEDEIVEMLQIYQADTLGGGFIARHYPQPWDINLTEDRQRLIYDIFMANGCR